MAAAATPFRAKKQRALHAIRSAVKGLSPEEIVDVLAQELKAAAKKAVRGKHNQKLVPPALFERRPGRPSSIEKDPELEEFILAQSGNQTLQHIVELCVEEFGEERAPSKSALHRYIQGKIYRSKGDK